MSSSRKKNKLKKKIARFQPLNRLKKMDLITTFQIKAIDYHAANGYADF